MDTSTAGLPPKARTAIRKYIGWLASNLQQALDAGDNSPRLVDCEALHEQRVLAARAVRRANQPAQQQARQQPVGQADFHEDLPPTEVSPQRY